jgi:iron(III) transport system permease protein
MIFGSFFETTTEYSSILKETFLLDYIFNSLILLLGVLILTSVIGIGCAYLISFYDFPGATFFKWALILSFAVPAYIYSYSLTAFFENFGTAYSLLKGLFGEGNYNNYIPKLDGMVGATYCNFIFNFWLCLCFNKGIISLSITKSY